MKAEENRNALDFLKFVFAILIVLFHSNMLTSDQENMIVINGRAGVEFFFMVSGCLMCASAARSTEENIGLDTWYFIKKKIFRLMPNYLIAYVLAFIVYHYNASITEWNRICINAIKSLPELLLIKNSGVRFASYNGPTWYISAMILNMLVLYPLIRKFKDSFYIIALVLILFILGAFFQTYGTFSDLEDWNGWILKGTVRGTAGLCAGCLCYKIAMILRRKKWTTFAKSMFMLIEWECYIIAIIFCCKYASSRIDYLIFFLFMIGVTITYSNISFDKTLFQSRIFCWLGSFSFSLYLSHSCWREFTSNIYPQQWGFTERLICYLLAAVWSGLFVHYLSILLRALKSEKMKDIKALFIVPAED